MINRESYMKKIRPFLNTELVKVFTGLRRSGKSVMLELVKNELVKNGADRENFLSLNFEQFSNSKYKNAESLYSKIVEFQKTITEKNANAKIYLFFDEIQEVSEWERVVNSCRVDFDCDIYITGSNAKLLSGELATYLAGRYVEFVIYPFSFSEFFESARQKSVNLEKRIAFNQFLKIGGMPFLSNYDFGNFDEILSEAKNQYLLDIYNSVVLKDIVKRNNIRDVDQLERLIFYVLENIGHTFSSNSISKYFKSENRTVSHETIMNYLKFCTDSFLLYKINREDLEGKKILTVNEKYYCADHGLREAIFGKNQQNIDQILENIVCLELLKRNYKVSVGKKGDFEIDFVASKNGEKSYFQICYLLSTEEAINREFCVFDKIKDNFPKYVLSLDDFDFSRNGIIHKNLIDWLLEE